MYSIRIATLLLDLVVNAYDDVRNYATALLKLFEPSATTPSISSTELNTRIQLALDRAESSMRRTGRASYADGVGRLYDLVYERQTIVPGEQTHDRYSIVETLLTNLENDIQIAIKDLPLAVSKAPVHGRLIALRQGPLAFV